MSTFNAKASIEKIEEGLTELGIEHGPPTGAELGILGVSIPLDPDRPSDGRMEIVTQYDPVAQLPTATTRIIIDVDRLSTRMVPTPKEKPADAHHPSCPVCHVQYNPGHAHSCSVVLGLKRRIDELERA